MSYNAIAADGADQPTALADLHMWRLAASPGWGEAYDYAMQTRLLSNPVPVGADPAVITDAQILAAVQAIVAA